MICTEGGSTQKFICLQMPMAMPVKCTVTEGTGADSQKAEELLKGHKPQFLIVDKAYNTDKIIAYLSRCGIENVFPPEKTGKYQDIIILISTA